MDEEDMGIADESFEDVFGFDPNPILDMTTAEWEKERSEFVMPEDEI